MSKILCSWSGLHLWGRGGFNGLALTKNGYYRVVDSDSGVMGGLHTKDYLLAADRNWLLALNLIENGHKPDWHDCSCGSKFVMGGNWDNHTAVCDSLTLPSPFGPKNNDGRSTCYKCEDPTRQAGGGQYMICKNKDCEWFDK